MIYVFAIVTLFYLSDDLVWKLFVFLDIGLATNSGKLTDVSSGRVCSEGGVPPWLPAATSLLLKVLSCLVAMHALLCCCLLKKQKKTIFGSELFRKKFPKSKSLYF